VQICAEALGQPVDRVRFVKWNTSSTPDSGPTSGSRTTLVGGNAVKIACENLVEQMRPAAATALGVPLEEVSWKPGSFGSTVDDSARITFSETIVACLEQGVSLMANGFYQVPRTTGLDPENGQGKPFFDYVYGCDVAEVEVNTETGQVRVLRYITAHDVGRAINPALVAGQMIGGVCMGLGTALFEEYRLVDGKQSMLNFDQYLIPTAADMGPVEAVIVESGMGEGPFGSLSIAEPALQIVAPALVNAIARATGKRVYDLPADLESVLLGHRLERKTRRGSDEAHQS
jgi:CO/xanthine dehydrogenase Mo-binding subunit